MDCCEKVIVGSRRRKGRRAEKAEGGWQKGKGDGRRAER
jgi:hypothetical protein